MTAPTNGAVSEETSRIAIILGMNVSVTSCTCVNAWSRAMTMPTAMAAATAGPDATITVHKADWTMSSASAWFMSLHRDAGAELQFLPVVQNGHRAAGDHPHARDRARDAAIVRPIRPSAWVRARDVLRVSSLLLVLIACSTLEKEASCATNWDGSVGFVGSWFFIWAMSSCRKES